MNNAKTFKIGTCSNCRRKNKPVMKHKTVQLCRRCMAKAEAFSRPEKLALFKLMNEWA